MNKKIEYLVKCRNINCEEIIKQGDCTTENKETFFSNLYKKYVLNTTCPKCKSQLRLLKLVYKNIKKEI